jgi:molecular chaperone HscB
MPFRPRRCDLSSSSSSSSSNKDAFALFNLPHSFAIDEDSLKSAYRKLMAEYHPDRQNHHHKQSKDDTISSMQASDITAAYECLRHHHTRATHLMERLGRPIIDQKDNSGVMGVAISAEFLTRVMHVREIIDEANQQQDVLQRLHDENRQRNQSTGVELQQAIETGQFDRAAQLTAHLQYWNRIDETIRSKLDVSE